MLLFLLHNFAWAAVIASRCRPKTTVSLKPGFLRVQVVEDIDGKAVNLSEYRGKVSLVVNVASQ